MPNPSQEELDRIKSLLKEINGLYSKIGDKNPFSKFDTRNITDAVASVGQLEAGLRDAKNRFDALTDGAQELYGAFKGIVNEIKSTNSSVTDSVKGYSKLGELARRLRDDQKGITALNAKDLKSIQSKLQSEVQNLRLSTEQAKVRSSELNIKRRNYTITDRERTELKEIGKTLFTNNKFLTEHEGILEETNKFIKERIEKEKEIQKNLGISGALLKGINKIPFLNNLLHSEEALAAAQEKAAKNGSNRIKVLGASFKSLGKSLITNLSDPLLVLGLVFTQIKSAIFAIDENAGKLAKNMNISYKEALSFDNTLREIAYDSNDIFITTKSLGEAYTDLSKSIGANVSLTQEELKTYTLLQQRVGLTSDEISSISRLTAITGKSAKEVSSNFLGAAKSLSLQKGLSINVKQLLKDTAGISNSIKLSLGGGETALAKAMVSAKGLGTSLEKVDQIAGSLLNFEDSISSELEAELLLGKSINLETARYAALMGNLTTVAEEIKKEIGSSAEFAGMNRIQQEAIAKAVGMTREELANTLVEQEALSKLGRALTTEEKDAFEFAKQKYGEAKATKMLGEGQLELMMKQQSAQESFNMAVEKLKDLFVSMVDGPLGKLLNSFVTLISNTKVLKGVLIGLSAVLTPIVIKLGIAAISAITTASALTLGLGIAGALAGIAVATNVMDNQTEKIKNQKFVTKENDAIIDPKGGIVVSGPEGSIQLNKKDSIIAGTNLGGGQGSSSPELIEIKNILTRILNKDTNIYMDSTKTGTAYNIGSVRIQ